jgi:excisionase family DNA binding protein
MSFETDLAEIVRRVLREELERHPANSGPQDPLELLTPAQVAELFKLSPETVASYCKAGKLPGHKFGHEWRLPRAGLANWVERHGLPADVPSPKAEAERIMRALRTGSGG